MTEETSDQQGAKGSYIAQSAKGATAIVNIAQQALDVAEGTEKFDLYAVQKSVEGVSDYINDLLNILRNTDAITGGPYKGLLAYRLNDTSTAWPKSFSSLGG